MLFYITEFINYADDGFPVTVVKLFSEFVFDFFFLLFYSATMNKLICSYNLKV